MKIVAIIIKKELNCFFASASGYIIISVFLVVAALFLWLIPNRENMNGYNILDNGFASLDGIFVLAPWLFLFLCPAVTMRLFAEERQQGTLEMLLSRPVSKLSIVTGKALAAWILVIISLIGIIIWYISINLLAVPSGNVDSGAFWGSYIGLLFLSGIYISIGIFASVIAANQVTAFVLAAVLCFMLYIGFDFISSLFTNGTVEAYISMFGINSHYRSISRGVIDSRDLLYFITVSTLFLWSSKVFLK
jgi:ABC-2 type transport system permease protein